MRDVVGIYCGARDAFAVEGQRDDFVVSGNRRRDKLDHFRWDGLPPGTLELLAT